MHQVIRLIPVGGTLGHASVLDTQVLCTGFHRQQSIKTKIAFHTHTHFTVHKATSECTKLKMSGLDTVSKKHPREWQRQCCL